MKNIKIKFHGDSYELLSLVPRHMVDECSHSGACDDDVDDWFGRLSFDIVGGNVAEYLKSTGAWEPDDLLDHDTNIKRLIWMIACDLNERV